jgi:hypothetical protein
MYKTVKPLSIISLAAIITLLGLGCKKKMTPDELVNIGLTKTKKMAPYILRTGLDINRLALSTTELNIFSLTLVQYPKKDNDSTDKRVIWQHPSWQKFGPMGSITSDEVGNAYTASIPVINTMNLSYKRLGIIFHIDPETGEMNKLLELPVSKDTLSGNPYHVIGLHFDNHGQKLYISTILGSDKDNERGIIYVVDPKTKSIVDRMENVDAFGLFVAGYTGEKRLYYGLARKPEIQSVELSKEGLFEGSPKAEMSLQDLGPRGNDKARRIRLDKFGNMGIYGTDFNYNLQAQTVRQESLYSFKYDRSKSKWIFTKWVR